MSDAVGRHEEFRELTLRDILLGIGDYARELWRRKWWIVGTALLFAAFFAWRAVTTPATYEAPLTFMINEEDGGSALGGLASVLGSVGINAGGGEYNYQKIIELAQSQLIMQEVLLDSIKVDGHRDRIVHHLQTIYGPDREWSPVSYPADSLETFDQAQRKRLQQLHRLLVGTDREYGLLRMSYAVSTTILKLRAITLHEDLSYGLANTAYRHLSDFYIDRSTRTAQETLAGLRGRTDSIRRELNSAEYQLARLQDASLGLLNQRDRVATGQAQRRVNILTILYGEVVKNMATAEFTLSSGTPFFVVVDRPFLPLDQDRENLIKQVAIGVILGAFAAGAVVLSTYTIRNAIRER